MHLPTTECITMFRVRCLDVYSVVRLAIPMYKNYSVSCIGFLWVCVHNGTSKSRYCMTILFLYIDPVYAWYGRTSTSQRN